MRPEHLIRLLSRELLFIPPILPHIAKHLPPKGIVVDLGAGYGTVSLRLARLFPDLLFVAVDIDPERLSIARRLGRKLKNLRLVLGDMRRIRFRNVSVFLLIDSISYLTDPEQEELLAGCHGSLVRGGKLIIKTNDRRPVWQYKFALLEERAITGLRMNYPDSRRFKPLLRRLGFELLELRRVYPLYPYPGVLYVCLKTG